ncbi:hypothetical protein A3Q56_01203 [Intoshia linei]|uniref:EF-hand domain-containing protein n=1 Tax=Intoshia linei TaxID=1819745 RepID=A0A177B9P8_9BILA|nr:hypothetical protein A3Q56_01203 [Intoshia linei]
MINAIDNDEERIAILTEAFNLFDKDKKGYIHCEQLGKLLRCVGQNLNDIEFAYYKENFCLTDTDNLQLTAFLEIMTLRRKTSTNDESLTEAFRIFDVKRTGYIANKDLRDVLTTMGEILSEEEISELIQEADTDSDGFIDYEDFISKLMKI